MSQISSPISSWIYLEKDSQTNSLDQQVAQEVIPPAHCSPCPCATAHPIEESRTWGHNSSALPMWAGPPARTGWDCPLSPHAGGLLQTDRQSPSAGRTLLTQSSPTCPTGDLLSEPFMQIALPGQPDIAALSWGLVTR